jgi:hypothetical protein
LKHGRSIQSGFARDRHHTTIHDAAIGSRREIVPRRGFGCRTDPKLLPQCSSVAYEDQLDWSK